MREAQTHKHALDLFVAELRHALVVLRRFDDDFVRAEGAHLVVHAFGQPAGFTFDAIQRIGMRQHANLPRRLRRARSESTVAFR